MAETVIWNTETAGSALRCWKWQKGQGAVDIGSSLCKGLYTNMLSPTTATATRTADRAYSRVTGGLVWPSSENCSSNMQLTCISSILLNLNSCQLLSMNLVRSLSIAAIRGGRVPQTMNCQPTALPAAILPRLIPTNRKKRA